MRQVVLHDDLSHPVEPDTNPLDAATALSQANDAMQPAPRKSHRRANGTPVSAAEAA
jgi:hypothetical protein